MKKRRVLIGLIFLVTTSFLVSSCKKEEPHPTFPLSALIFHSVVDKKVAFTALTHSAVSWNWDFGDGTTSTDENPVHEYTTGGYYIATLTATDKDGKSVEAKVNLAIDLTPFDLLVGDHTADGYAGKTWKLTAQHGNNGDYFAIADASLSPVAGTPVPLPTGIFDTSFGMGAIYKDTYTFFFDGSYKHDVKDDGAAFGGIVYQFVLNGGKDIVNANGKNYGLCIAKYTPQANATFTYTAKENFNVPSVYGAGGVVTYSNVGTLNFSGTEFVGFRDYQQKVIIKKITDTSMQLVMFMAASPDYFPAATNALVLSFEVVK